MAGHSHSTNIKYRKDRQDNERSKIFLKFSKKIENIIKLEGHVNEKILNDARKIQFPKEKIYQIYYRIKEKSNEKNEPMLFQSNSKKILIYLIDNKANEILSNVMNKIPSSLIFNYFKLVYSLIIELINKNSLEDFLLNLPINFLEKINYNEEKKKFSSIDKKLINELKLLIQENSNLIILKEEKKE